MDIVERIEALLNLLHVLLKLWVCRIRLKYNSCAELRNNHKLYFSENTPRSLAFADAQPEAFFTANPEPSTAVVDMSPRVKQYSSRILAVE